jgi:acyl-coenzyme A thioesterase PaaI-like protein
VNGTDGVEELAGRARRLVEAVRTTEAPSAVLEEAGRRLDEVTALLERHRWAGPYAQSSLYADTQPIDFRELAPEAFFPYSPVIGPRNPIAPPCRFVPEEDGTLTGTMEAGPAYCGPPGFVHGGVIALVFDELLGTVNVLAGLGAMTGTLVIRYRRPTPIQQPIAMRAWIDRTEGRKVFARGEMRHEGEVTAEAEGVFVRVQLLEG